MEAWHWRAMSFWKKKNDVEMAQEHRQEEAPSVNKLFPHCVFLSLPAEYHLSLFDASEGILTPSWRC